MENERPDDESIDRREFLETSGYAAAAAASWWALTEKTDALAQSKSVTPNTFGGDPTDRDYHYVAP